MTIPRLIARRDFLRLTGIAAGSLAIAPAFSAPRKASARCPAAVPLAWRRAPTSAAGSVFPRTIPRSTSPTIFPPPRRSTWHIGLKHVRLCVAPKVIMNPASGEIIEERGQQLEAAIERFHRAGLAVVVDIHNEDRRAELDPQWQEAFIRFWGLLARRLSRFDPELTILEIINEPVFKHREDEWNTLNARLAAAIRRRAPRHTIITSGPNWGGIDGLKKLTLLPDRNVVYSFHCYDPFTFTHQGTTWTNSAVRSLHDVPYPSSPEAVKPLWPGLESSPEARKMVEWYGKERWNKEKLAARFHQGIESGAKTTSRCTAANSGSSRASKPEDRARWFQDFGAVLAENRIGWAVWGWDEGFGLNRKMAGGKPVVDAVVAQALRLKL